MPLVPGLAADLVRSRPELLAENALLRQQLIVAQRQVKRPAFRPGERGIVVALSAVLRGWRQSTLLVRPETVLRWHRDGFKIFWKRRSKQPPGASRRLPSDIVELIRRMARENRLWGAERIRGELLKLGIHVAKRTIQLHIRSVRPPGDGQSWRVFLRNHTVWSCDFVRVYDLWFRPIYAFFIVDVNEKCVVRAAVTRTPIARWAAQQLRAATDLGCGPDVIVRDGDHLYSPAFDVVASGVGARVVETAYRAPLMNSVCERFIGSVRRECLDHVLVLGEGHLRAVVSEYVGYYNSWRPHQGIEQRVPEPGDVLPPSAPTGAVKARSFLGGLHHDYVWAA